jgi:hypothetical protein
VLVVTILSTISAIAQGNGTAGITEATQMVTSYFDPATQLILLLDRGLIGGVKVYNKFSSGDQILARLASWFELVSFDCSGNCFTLFPLVFAV